VPSPGAWTVLGDARIKLWPLDAAGLAGAGAGDFPAPGDLLAPGETLAPGELRAGRSAVLVGTATGPVQLGDVQPPGKRRMRAVEWARGLRQDSMVLA
jgi:methionyl-tRNA formyltransferase